MWGVGGSRFVGVLLPTQAHFASGIAIELAPLTNKYILGVDESRWKLLLDKKYHAEEGVWLIYKRLFTVFLPEELVFDSYESKLSKNYSFTFTNVWNIYFGG